MKIALAKPRSASRLSQGYIICLTSTVLWASTAIFIRYLTEGFQLPSLVLAFWRDLFVSIGLALAFILFSPATFKVRTVHLGFLVLYGFILSIFNSIWTISIVLNGAAVATVLAYSSAAFTVILGWKLFGESLGMAKIAACGLSLLGLAFVSGAYDPNAWRINSLGIVMGLLSGLAFSTYSLMGRAASHRSINPWTTLFYTFTFASFFLLFYNLSPSWMPSLQGSHNLFWLGSSLLGWGILVVLSIGPTVGGYGLYTVSLTYLPASVANLIATLEPALTAALAYAFLNERLTSPQLLGSVLIIAGVLILRLLENHLPTRRPETQAV